MNRSDTRRVDRQKLALLATVGIAAGVGLAAFASRADVQPGTPAADERPSPAVQKLPRVTVTPLGTSVFVPVPQASEACTRLHC